MGLRLAGEGARIEAKGRERTHQSYQSRLGRPFSETCQVNSRCSRVGSPLASRRLATRWIAATSLIRDHWILVWATGLKLNQFRRHGHLKFLYHFKSVLFLSFEIGMEGRQFLLVYLPKSSFSHGPHFLYFKVAVRKKAETCNLRSCYEWSRILKLSTIL